MASKRPRPNRALATLTAIAVGGILLSHCSPPSRVTAPSGQTLGRLPKGVAADGLSLLIVTLDTTRADRIGSYGFDGIATPNLDRLAREGVLFEQAESVAPLTLPAHSSIFTGELPPAHGVRDNGGFYLAEERVVLAEILRDEGFRTGGFVGSFVLDAKWGIAQGFDTYFDDFDLQQNANLSFGEIQRTAADVTDAAIGWLDEAPTARFFSWVHFYDPHSPYEPPEPFATRYRDRPYVGEIAYVDSQIGRLLDWLDQHDRARDTVVMVIGDHGESLGEHGEVGHGFFIYESATRVPFIVRAPFDSMRGRRVSSVVRSIDLLPTALDLLAVSDTDRGAESSAGVASSGASLAGLLTGAVQSIRLPAYSEALYPRNHYGWSDLAALRVGDMKYIAAPREELYDLSADPGEEHDLAAESTDLVEQMRRQLDTLESALRTNAPNAAVDEIDPDTRARLAALGYVSSFVESGAESADRSALADPKDKIHLYNLLRRAREASLGEDGSAEAIQALERVLAEDPSVTDAWVRLGNEQLRIDQPQAAIESFRAALGTRPDYDLAIINLAKAYRTVGADAEALDGYRQFLRLDPRNARVHFELAQMLIERNGLDEAEEHLVQALQYSPEMAAAQVARGLIALRRSAPDRATALINDALAIKPDVRRAHFNLAILAEERGELEEAAGLYRRELELYPQSFKAEFNLGRLLGSLGDRRGAIAALERAIEINPQFAEGHFFLAKALLDSNSRLDRAIELARTGLELGPTSEMAPMGHYLLADIFTRLGRPQEAQRELASARALQNAG